MTNLAIVVLAAGMGTRMKSTLPKVLHRIAGRSLLGHALHAAKALQPEEIRVVHGPDNAAVIAEAQKIFPNCKFALQAERQGTGHAVMMAENSLKHFNGTVLILSGDVPMVQPDSLRALLAELPLPPSIAPLQLSALLLARLWL